MKTKIFRLTAAGCLLYLLTGASVAQQNTDTDAGPIDAAAAAQQDLQFWEELAFWQAIKDSDNADDLNAFLDAYPDGRFAGLVRVRLLTLAPPETETETGTETAAPPPPANDYIANTNANVRAAPTVQASRLGNVRQGERLQVLGEAAGGEWYRVQLEDGGVGYVYASLLEPALAEATTAESETAPADGGQAFRDCPDCPALVTIPAGSFTMGSDQRRDEQPLHAVSIDQPFALGVFEVSIEEWSRCVDDGGCRYDPPPQSAESRLPISNVSWDDAQQYLDWLSRKTGQRYRLPTEAEWEYAARAGSDDAYWWGAESGRNQANCRDCGSRWDGQQAAPVGAFAANRFGLYDVHGNVWEWTQDCWNGSHQDAPVDGSARVSGDCLARVLRGGAWKLDADSMRSARRSKYDRDVRYFLNGFRVARDL